MEHGIIVFATVLFVLVGIMVINCLQKRMEVKYDEDEQTAQDYSILVSNPPPDATNPDEWRLFFRDNFDGAHTTAITIAVDNDLLVHSLRERRECMRKIEMKLEPGTSLSIINLARISTKIEQERSFMSKVFAKIVPGIPELFGRVASLTARVQGLSQQDYPATSVFVSFETEASQRLVLSKLSVGSMAANRNQTSVMAQTPNYLFRRKFLLNVQEPDEPSTVRWEDLNTKALQRYKQLLLTAIVTIGGIALIALFVRIMHDVSPVMAALTITAFNGIFPQLALLLTKIESHPSEGSKQTSLYFKIAIFRWVITAVIITIITPFTKTLDKDDGLIESIYQIFFADIIFTNGFQLLDPLGHIQRHILAPRAATQDGMNLNMRGLDFELAERYTNMTKSLFLALWYFSIFPWALFMCSFALLVNFFVDRFSLMRTWKPAPALGTTISQFSRRYFFSTAIIAMSVVSAYSLSGMPFDNLCVNEEERLDPIYLGSWNITTEGSGEKRKATVETNTDNVFDNHPFEYCFQDLFRTKGRSFPPLPKWQPEGSEWMTEDQETVVTLNGWFSVVVVIFVLLSFLWIWFNEIKGLFGSTYEPSGEDQHINFSDVPSISTYVPQVTSNVFSYPLLACNIKGIDTNLFEWTDPDRPHSYYDLTKDADELLEGTDISSRTVFSTIRHYPPKIAQKKKKKKVFKSKRNPLFDGMAQYEK